jgi:hypothetical protein
VEVLSRIYAGCMAGMDEVWILRMSAELHFEAGAAGQDVKSRPEAGETGRGRRCLAWGAVGVRELAEDGIRCQVMAKLRVACKARLPWSEPVSADHGLAPPAGFEPAHTAPEAVALSPELWGLRCGP